MKIRTSLFLGFVATSLFACGGADDTPPAEPSITVKFTVANLPETLLVNKETTPVNTIEYQWLVVFDVDRDGKESAGDLTTR